jgi:tRNA (guanine37-N1)-methyltransferase
MDSEVYAIKISKKKAQKVINKIKKEKIINNKYKIQRDSKFVYIPIIKNKKKDLQNYKIIKLSKKIEQKEKSKKFKDLLLEKFKKNKIDLNNLKLINSSYDIVGDIIIIGLKKGAEKYYDIIGKTLFSIHPHCKVVLNKIGKHHGVYRTQNMEHVYGEDRKITTIKENGCKIKIDVEKVFCSTRLSNERKRIASLIKEPNETIGVFFAGAGPFAIVIAKSKKTKEIIGIELNPIAVDFFEENVKINKVEEKIKIIQGDVKKVSKQFKSYFDRIVMPLPKSADLFLDSAIYSSKNKGIIHIYRFVDKNNPYENIKKIIKDKEEEKNIKLEIINKKIIRSYSPSIVQIVLDIKLKK